ncbi:CHASE2 domain-containing protein [Aggregatilineales bacterium SYSU G02658]
MRAVRTAPYSLRRALLSGALISLLLLTLFHMGAFTALRLSLTNIYYLDSTPSDQIILVALDNASFAAFGRAPSSWDRTLYADLVTRLSEAGARAIVFDILFSEPTPQDAAFAEALAAARASEARTRIVMAAAGVNISTSIDHPQYNRGIRFETVLLPTPALQAVSDYVGFVNVLPDADSRVRRQLSLIQVGSAPLSEPPALSLSLAAYLAYLRIPPAALSQVILQAGDQLRLASSQTLQVDPQGLWRQNFFTSTREDTPARFATVSMVDVLNGSVDPALFRGRIVLVGILNSTGATDQALTPNSASPMAGVEIQANAIESLLQRRTLTEPSPTQESLVIVAFAVLSMLAYDRVTWRYKALLLLGAVLAYLVVSYIQFDAINQINNLFYPLLALILPFTLSVAFDVTDEIARRIRSEAQVNLLRELNARTEAERETLRQLNELKTRMIRMASHDLKNPLQRVLGYSELLLDDDTLDDSQRKFVTNIFKASDEMYMLISELLDLEQLRSTGELNLEPLEFNDLVRTVAQRHEPDVYRREQHYTLDLAPDPLPVKVDGRKLSQAIANLIGNAIKYTPDGGSITVRVCAHDGMARLEVHDTGYGIPAEALPNLFSEFFRAKTAATQHIKGTGLGLSLVKQIVTAHSGRVWAESVEGQGSTFYLEIPLCDESAQRT